MKKIGLVDWVQMATGLAVLIGLGLVVWELQQSREATRLQLTSDYFQINAQLKSASLGENPGEVLAKSCYAPDSLTDADLMVLQGYYDVKISNVLRLRNLSTGTFYEKELWRQTVAGGLMELFVSTPGRGYWKTIARFWVDPEVLQLGDEVLSNMPPPQCKDDMNAWKKYITEASRRH